MRVRGSWNKKLGGNVVSDFALVNVLRRVRDRRTNCYWACKLLVSNVAHDR